MDSGFIINPMPDNYTTPESVTVERLRKRIEKLESENKRLLEQVEDLQKEIEWKQKQIVSLRQRGKGNV